MYMYSHTQSQGQYVDYLTEIFVVLRTHSKQIPRHCLELDHDNSFPNSFALISELITLSRKATVCE